MVNYYKKKIPSVDDIVIARVDEISQYGVDVSLPEYNYIKGFINCSEISRKKKVNMNKLLTIGKEILLIVIQVDYEKNYIDLSKRSINEEEIKIFNEKNKQHIQLYNIFKHIFMKINNYDKPDKFNQDELYNFMVDTLFEIQSEYENSYILEKIFIKDNNLEILEPIIEDKPYKINEIKKIIDEYIDTKLNRTKSVLNNNIKLLSYNINGLDDIKYTLDYLNFESYNDLVNDYNININYISGSIYSIEIEQKEFENTNIKINDTMILIKNEIKKRAEEKGIQYQI